MSTHAQHIRWPEFEKFHIEHQRFRPHPDDSRVDMLFAFFLAGGEAVSRAWNDREPQLLAAERQRDELQVKLTQVAADRDREAAKVDEWMRRADSNAERYYAERDKLARLTSLQVSGSPGICRKCGRGVSLCACLMPEFPAESGSPEERAEQIARQCAMALLNEPDPNNVDNWQAFATCIDKLTPIIQRTCFPPSGKFAEARTELTALAAQVESERNLAQRPLRDDEQLAVPPSGGDGEREELIDLLVDISLTIQDRCVGHTVAYSNRFLPFLERIEKVLKPLKASRSAQNGKGAEKFQDQGEPGPGVP